MCEKKTEDKENMAEDAVFYNLILQVTYHHVY